MSYESRVQNSALDCYTVSLADTTSNWSCEKKTCFAGKLLASRETMHCSQIYDQQKQFQTISARSLTTTMARWWSQQGISLLSTLNLQWDCQNQGWAESRPVALMVYRGDCSNWAMPRHVGYYLTPHFQIFRLLSAFDFRRFGSVQLFVSSLVKIKIEKEGMASWAQNHYSFKRWIFSTTASKETLQTFLKIGLVGHIQLPRLWNIRESGRQGPTSICS